MFEGPRIGIVGLMEMDVIDRMLRLCDGGVFDWPGQGVFVSFDPEFGTIGAAEAPEERIGDSAPDGQLRIDVPTIEAAVTLAQPQMQGRDFRLWIAEYDVETGAMLGLPSKIFEGMVDTMTTGADANQRTVTITFMDAGERLFSIREGNVLSTRFHQTAWPGELGFEFCTGVGVQVPWGTSGPARGTTTFGGGGGSFGSFARSVSA